MTKNELVEAIQEAYVNSNIPTKKEAFSTLDTNAYGITKRYSLSSILGMYTKSQLEEILNHVLSNTEEIMIQTEDIEENEEFNSSIEMNNLFNEVGLLIDNLELEEENLLTVETNYKPIHIYYDSGLYYMSIDYNSIGSFKFDEILEILKNLFKDSKLE